MSLLAIPTVSGGAITLSTTPTPISPGQNYVQRITVKAIPGYMCKVFIGAAGHDRSTYSGVYAILFPNAIGGHSEEFTLEAPGGQDSVDLNKIFLSTDCPGEQVSHLTYKTGTLGAALRFLRSGPVTPLAGASKSLWGGATNLSASIHIQVIPGMVGKVQVRPGNGSAPLAQLYPNTGNTNQSNAHSERWSISDQFGGLRPDLLFLSADVAGEAALVTVLTYN